jgi:hypothetical protein
MTRVTLVDPAAAPDAVKPRLTEIHGASVDFPAVTLRLSA